MTRSHGYSLLQPLVLFLLAGATGCSAAPSVGAAEDYLREKVEEQSKGRLALVSFKKIDGQEGEAFGVPVYALEYEAEIEALETCYWLPNFVFYGERSFRTLAPDEADVFTGIQGFKPAEKGRRASYTGTFRFEQTERGWKGPGGRIY